MSLNTEYLSLMQLNNYNKKHNNIIELYDEIYNPKLTLTQLKHMEAVPIFIIVLNNDCKLKTGWKINNGECNECINTINAFSMCTENFLLADYEKSWIAFKYEKYVDITNPSLDINDIKIYEDRELPNYYYFIADDDIKTGWKRVIDKDNEKLIVENHLDKLEYFYFNEHKSKWNAYKKYRY